MNDQPLTGLQPAGSLSDEGQQAALAALGPIPSGYVVVILRDQDEHAVARAVPVESVRWQRPETPQE